MTTGPEHYRAAQELLRDTTQPSGSERRAQVIAVAQVHATLALAAAVAGLDAYNVDGVVATGRRAGDSQAWRAATDG